VSRGEARTEILNHSLARSEFADLNRSPSGPGMIATSALAAWQYPRTQLTIASFGVPTTLGNAISLARISSTFMAAHPACAIRRIRQGNHKQELSLPNSVAL
jgi:hypothetical protein